MTFNSYKLYSVSFIPNYTAAAALVLTLNLVAFLIVGLGFHILVAVGLVWFLMFVMAGLLWLISLSRYYYDYYYDRTLEFASSALKNYLPPTRQLLRLPSCGQLLM
jgi:hypothetical protein